MEGLRMLLVAAGLAVGAFGGPAVRVGSVAMAAPAIKAVDPPKPQVRWKLEDQRRITGDDHVAATVVRFTLPKTWTRLKGTAARYHFRTGSYGCVLEVTVMDRVVVGRAESATKRLTRDLPAQSSRHVLDEGTRGNAAWRVVRTEGAAIIGRFAIRSPRLEQGIGDSVDAVWHEVDITTTPSGECHAGHYRGAGARIGDALASLERKVLLEP